MVAAMNPTEQELIGAAIVAPGITAEQHLAGAQFDDMRLGDMWEAIRRIHLSGATPTPATLESEIPGMDPGLLVECTGLGIPANAGRYADEIRDLAWRRDVRSATMVAQQMLDEGAPVDDAIARVASVPAPVDKPAAAVDFTDFVTRQLPPTEWVVDGLIARGDRLVLTGTEGLGKTVLLRQLAVCAAAGVQPFTGDTSPVRRVLFVDCENPERIMIGSFRKLRDALHIETRIPLRIARFPQGLDLTRTSDRLTLRQLLVDNRPDLLVIGPVYKLYVGGANSREEDLARAVTACLDGLREEFGFALAMEHHAPHKESGRAFRDVRPIGSSLWLRWPEFGLGIAPDDGYRDDNRVVKVVHWRGDRDSRPWPAQLVQGAVLPWIDSGADSHHIRRTA
jgi:replicative DNA helicase